LPQRWAAVLESRGVRAVVSGGPLNSGCGFAKNRAIEQARGLRSVYRHCVSGLGDLHREIP
jgi:hypothetical protein